MASSNFKWLASAMLLFAVLIALAADPSQAAKTQQDANVASYSTQGHGDKHKCTCEGFGTGLVSCGGECVNPLTSSQCCGRDNHPDTNRESCRPDQVCRGGDCVCPGNFIECEGVCVNPLTSNQCCGGVDECIEGEVCRAGVCDCPEGTRNCADIGLCVPEDVECEDVCEPPPPADNCNNAGLSNRDQCGEPGQSGCKRCGGTREACINGVCVPCRKNGSTGNGDLGDKNKGCERNTDCCSCNCVDDGNNQFDKCTGPQDDTCAPSDNRLMAGAKPTN